MSNTNEQTSQQSKSIADAKEYLASLGLCPQKLDEYLDQFPTNEHAVKLGTLILEIVLEDMRQRYEGMKRLHGPRKAKRLMAYYCLHFERLNDSNISIEQSYRVDKQIGRLCRQSGAHRHKHH